MLRLQRLKKMSSVQKASNESERILRELVNAYFTYETKNTPLLSQIAALSIQSHFSFIFFSHFFL